MKLTQWIEEMFGDNGRILDDDLDFSAIMSYIIPQEYKDQESGLPGKTAEQGRDARKATARNADR